MNALNRSRLMLSGVMIFLLGLGSPQVGTKVCAGINPPFKQAPENRVPNAAVSRGREGESLEGVLQHPLDRELAKAEEGLGPSIVTASLYGEFTRRWDAELNRIYAECVKAAESPEQRNALRHAQRQWMATREADKMVLDSIFFREGRATPTMNYAFHAFAVMELTRKRTLVLSQWLRLQREMQEPSL